MKKEHILYKVKLFAVFEWVQTMLVLSNIILSVIIQNYLIAESIYKNKYSENSIKKSLLAFTKHSQ